MTSSNKTNFVASFRAAVSLNNMGVCTLERGHFGAAMETLKDSLFIMKSVLNQGGNSSGSSYLLLQEDSKLQAARKRLAHSQAQPLLFPPSTIEIRPCDDGEVVAMKVPLMQLSSSRPSGPPPTLFIPIRLGSSSHQLPSVGGSEDSSARDHQEQLGQIFKIPSAVILYNYGMSNILVHLQNKTRVLSSSALMKMMTEMATASSITPDSQESLLHVGFVCFTMAHAILCQERAAVQQQKHDAVVSFEVLQAMILSGLVLHNLLFVFRMNPTTTIQGRGGGGGGQAAQEVVHTLSSLVHMIQVHEDVLRNMNIQLDNCKTACAA
jgi:hypothetical protein